MGKPKKRPGPPIYPMPIDLVLAAPGMASAPGGVYNAVITLAVVYWAGGCRPLPLENAELCALLRYAPPRWDRSRERVMTALEAVLPLLGARYAYLNRVWELQIAGCRRGGAATAARRARLLRPPSPIPLPDTRTLTVPTTPSKAQPYKPPGDTDMTSRQAAIDRNTQAKSAQNSTGTHKGLSDARLGETAFLK